MDDSRCRLCQGVASETFHAKEMMYGTQEPFSYFQCSVCGCVQISNIPENISEFYPTDYYSYQSNSVSAGTKAKAVVRNDILRSTGFSSFIRSKIVRRFPTIELMLYYTDLNSDRSAAILDVGCGAGALVRTLREFGYGNAIGIDPFVPRDIVFRDRPLVMKRDLWGVDSRYDIISFHHSLEHLPDQLAVLQRCSNLLASDGVLIVRIPVVGGEAWKTYREGWVQLDPPRHFYLHSLDSLSLIAAKAGLDVDKVIYDSSSFQFWGSELYKRGIPLFDPRTLVGTDPSSVFTSDEMASFERKACLANENRTGDQIVAWIRHART
jgi:SAM-dependent methyltransferase